MVYLHVLGKNLIAAHSQHLSAFLLLSQVFLLHILSQHIQLLPFLGIVN